MCPIEFIRFKLPFLFAHVNGVGLWRLQGERLQSLETGHIDMRSHGGRKLMHERVAGGPKSVAHVSAASDAEHD